MKHGHIFYCGILLLCSAFNLNAQDTPATIVSSADSGTYTLTLTHSNYPYVWGFSTNSGTIEMECFGVTNTIFPQGWKQEQQSDLYIWTYTTDVFFLEQTSIAFTLQSTFTNALTYSNTAWGAYYRRGLLVGAACPMTNHHPSYAGYQWFDHLGPAVPHFVGYGIEEGVVVVHLRDTCAASSMVEYTRSLDSGSWTQFVAVPSALGDTAVPLSISETSSPCILRFRCE